MLPKNIMCNHLSHSVCYKYKVWAEVLCDRRTLQEQDDPKLRVLENALQDHMCVIEEKCFS